MIYTRSSRITHLSWGSVEVEIDGHERFKDVKLYPGGAREWDWRETGTNHVPGIQPTALAELLEHGANVILVSLAGEVLHRWAPAASPQKKHRQLR